MVASRTEVVAERGVVAAGHPRAVEAGLRIFAQGGNAVDALIAAAFTSFVVEPASCGLGGYGRLAVFDPPRARFLTIDHYARAPLLARADLFTPDSSQQALYYGWPRVVGQRNEAGPLAPATPGAVAGLCAAHQRCGSRPLAELVEPAIEAAEAGVPVNWSLVLHIAGRHRAIEPGSAAAALLLPGGYLPRIASPGVVGDTLRFDGLARLLRAIGNRGAAAFYTGEIAAAIERATGGSGGLLTAADLASYQPKILTEDPARYRDQHYVTANDQVGYEALNILKTFDLSALLTPGRAPDSTFYHLVAEAFGHAFVDNMVHYGDPDHTDSPVVGLASPAFAAMRAAGIHRDRTAPRPIVPGDPWPFDDRPALAGDRPPPSVAGLAGTSQVVAADRAGRIASLCTSLTSSFGSLVYVSEGGFFLNNCMQNFDPRPDRANCIAPGKMPIFGVPVLVAAQAGQGSFGAAGSGGYRILSGVLHSFLHSVALGSGLRQALDAPRVHCQGETTFVDDRLGEAIIADLQRLGHEIVVQPTEPGGTPFGRVCAVSIDRQTGLLHAASSPAWNSAAGGW
jgi:gamma-glutamyltranspeptidase/glutathione hydrolase